MPYCQPRASSLTKSHFLIQLSELESSFYRPDNRLGRAFLFFSRGKSEHPRPCGASWQLLTATAPGCKAGRRESAAETILGSLLPKGEKSTDVFRLVRKLRLSVAGDGKRWKTLPGARANLRFARSAGKSSSLDPAGDGRTR